MLGDTEIDMKAEGSHYSLVGGNLVISNPIKTKHVGNYYCLASNMYGTIISREASVQFGCKWSRCEPPFNVQYHADLTENCPGVVLSWILCTLKLQGQLGQILSGVESAICEWSNFMMPPWLITFFFY